MKQTLHVAYGGVLTAFSLILLLLASIVPASGWGLCIAAGTLPSIPLVRGQARVGLIIYAATALLAFLIVPGKRYVVAYTLLFGIYPMIKHAIERIRVLPLEWVCKLLYAGALGLLVLGLFRRGLVPLGERVADLPYLPLWCGFLLAFACYDILFSKIIALFRIVFEKDQYNKGKKG